MNVAQLEARKQEIYSVAARAEAAVKTGQITQQQRDALLQSYYGSSNIYPIVAGIDNQITAMQEPDKNVNKTATLVIGFALFMVSLFVTLFYTTGGITAAVTLDHSLNTTYFANTTFPLEFVGATKINITGTAHDGTILITLIEKGNRHLLYAYNDGVQTEHASIEKDYYVVGEPVSFTATDLSSAYLMFDDAVLLDGNTVNNLSLGNYSFKLIINDTQLTQETLSFQVVESLPREQFNSCGELCSVNLTVNATVEINVSSNISVTIGSIIITNQENRPPLLVQEIPDITGEGTVHIEIRAAFHDADGDALYFDSSRHDGMTESVEDGIFTVTGPAGTYTYTVYASDLHELTPSNIFSITLLPGNTVNESLDANATNSTEVTNGTAVNTSVNSTVIDTTAAPASPPTDCSDPDPNRRPLHCIQGNDSTFFRPEEIFIENKNAVVVAQLTPVGNFLIRGELIEHSAASPRINDYQIGYANEAEEFIATVWIDSGTGDLHLRGALTEANGNIIINDGLSAMANRRGIVLALINRQSGDLTVRGNLIPYRRSLG